MTEKHALDLKERLEDLKERLSDNDEARKTSEQAKVLSELSVRQTNELSERVRVVEDGFLRLEDTQKQILIKLGELTATTPIERWLRILSMVGWLIFVGKTLLGGAP